MSQRWSPAVQFPLRRGQGLVWVLLGIAALQAVALLLWLVVGAGHGASWWARAATAAVVSAMAAGAGYRLWCSWPQGMLCWAQGRWWLEGAAGVQPLEGAPQVLWDLGAVLCLRFVRVDAGWQYVWLQKHWASSRWGDLRRAVYSSANTS